MTRRIQVTPAKPRKLYPKRERSAFDAFPCGKIVSLCVPNMNPSELELTIVRDGRRYRAVVRVISVEEE